MENSPRKLLLIGVDQAIPYLITKFVKEGLLPNISQLIDNGVYTEGYSCAPCDTPTNWTTIATGATTAVHGATSFYMHIPGESFELGLEKRSRTQLSRYCKAEYLWDVADRYGRTPFVINYPSGWPSNFKNGAMSALLWQVPEALPRVLTAPKQSIFSVNAEKVENRIIKTMLNHNYFDTKLEPLQIDLEVSTLGTSKHSILRLYVGSDHGRIYDTVFFQDLFKNRWYSLYKNEWSEWLSINISSNYGELPCLVRVKFQNLSDDGTSIEVDTSAIYNTKGWTQPEDISADLIKNVISYDLTSKIQDIEYKIEGKVESYLIYAQKEALTLGQAIKYAKKRLNWDICYFHIHLLDSVNHKELAYLHKESPLFSEGSFNSALTNVKTAYRIVDDLVGDLLHSCVDNKTIVAFVSDHGAMPAWKIVNIPSILMNSGLISYKWSSSHNKYVVNWKKTYAFPYLEPPFIWINLKGRDPSGIVNPSDYEDMRDKVIDMLNEVKDPDTGRKIIKLALKREDAAFLGLNGDRIGDIVYFLNPPYQIYDEKLEQLNPSQISPKYMAKPIVYDAQNCFGAHVYYLPTQRFGSYSNSVPIIIAGVGIKKGIKLENPVNLIDLAPTFTHLLQIPTPKDSQGRIIHELLI